MNQSPPTPQQIFQDFHNRLTILQNLVQDMASHVDELAKRLDALTARLDGHAAIDAQQYRDHEHRITELRSTADAIDQHLHHRCEQTPSICPHTPLL